MKRVAVVVAALIASFSIMPATALAQGKPKIVVFTKNVTNPFWKAVRIGADKAGKELGADIEHAAPTKPDNIEEQTRLVEDWIVRKPAAMVFVPVDFKALVPSIQKVNKAGIPVVIFSNRMSDVEFVTYVGSDDETIGYEITKYLIKTIGGKGKIVHIDGVPAAITAQNRKKGRERGGATTLDDAFFQFDQAQDRERDVRLFHRHDLIHHALEYREGKLAQKRHGEAVGERRR